MEVRRVSTGHDGSGKSRLVRDEALELKGLPGICEIALLWAGDTVPRFPASGEPTLCPRYFPTAEGYRFIMVTIEPEETIAASKARQTAESVADAVAEIEARIGAGMFAAMESDNPGMHTTDTVDCGVLLRGEVLLELDLGTTVLLKAGDTFVQNGTRHRWTNPGNETAVMAVVLIGGAPRAAQSRLDRNS